MNHQNNPLHGVKLEAILNALVEHYGWKELGAKVNINCFNHQQSIKSCLKFLRNVNHEWARTKVEKLYIELMQKQ